MKIRHYIWVLRYEPKRLWKWWHWHNIYGKRHTLKEAFRAVWENPPSFDISWENDMEKPLRNTQGLSKLINKISENQNNK